MYYDGTKERINRFGSNAMRRKSELASNIVNNSANTLIENFDEKQMITPSHQLNIDLTPPLPPIGEDYINLNAGIKRQIRIPNVRRSSFAFPIKNTDRVISSKRQNHKNIRSLNPTPTQASNYEETFNIDSTCNNSKAFNHFQLNKSLNADALNISGSESMPFPIKIVRNNINLPNQSVQINNDRFTNSYINASSEVPKLISLNLNVPNKPRIRKFSFVRKYLKTLDLKINNTGKSELKVQNKNNVIEEKPHDYFMNSEKDKQSRNNTSNLINIPKLKLDAINNLNNLNNNNLNDNNLNDTNNKIQINEDKVIRNKFKANYFLDFTTLTSFNLIRAPVKRSLNSSSIILNPSNFNQILLNLNNSQHYQRRISYLLNKNPDFKFKTGIESNYIQGKEEIISKADDSLLANTELILINNVISWLQNNLKDIFTNVFLIRLKWIPTN